MLALPQVDRKAALQVLKVAPLHKEALTAFAQLWLTVSRPQDAVGVAKRAAGSVPADPCAHRLYAQCLRWVLIIHKHCPVL